MVYYYYMINKDDLPAESSLASESESPRCEWESSLRYSGNEEHDGGAGGENKLIFRNLLRPSLYKQDPRVLCFTNKGGARRIYLKMR
jgi:hypothetical protein